MDFKLADFYDIEAGEPTDRLKETVTTILAVYESFLADNPVYRILLVGGIVREDTAVEGRKDIDFLLFTPTQKLGMSRWEIDNQNANNVFNRGYQDTISNQKIKNL